jgi:hypothetical protein
MNFSELMLAIQEVLSAENEEQLAAVLTGNPSLLERETLETLVGMSQQAERDGMEDVSEALQMAVVKIASFAMSQIQNANEQSASPTMSIEPNVEWAIKARRYLALQKDELLEEAINLAANEPEIQTFLRHFAEGNVPEVDKLTDELVPKLQQIGRGEEAITINLIYLHIRAGLAESFNRYTNQKVDCEKLTTRKLQVRSVSN